MAAAPEFPPVVSIEFEERPSLQVSTEGRMKTPEIETEVMLNLLGITSGIIGRTGFTHNGSRLYKDVNAEIGFPECRDPFELVAYLRAHDENMVEALSSLAAAAVCRYGAFGESTVSVGHRRRVMDAEENTWACHDNISISKALFRALQLDLPDTFTNVDITNRPATLLMKHLMMRSFISGAGRVGFDGLRYAQKFDTVEDVIGYDHRSYLYRRDRHQGHRLEIRCSDRNVNNAATVLRVGGAALVAALMSTPLVNELFAYAGQLPAFGKAAHLFNSAMITPDRTITMTPGIRRAVDFERRLAETSLDKLPRYMEVPEAYLAIAAMWLTYVEDFQKVLRGEATIDLLADRSDWARKFGLVLDYVAKDPDNRCMTDATARKIDHYYDATILTRKGSKLVRVDGPGVKDQCDESLPCTPHADDVGRAHYTPPDTRAQMRVKALTLGLAVKEGNWQMIIYRLSNDKELVFTLYPTYNY